MRFTPATEEQANAGGSFEPWRPGTVDLEVVGAADETSGSGNEMIHLEMNIYNAAGEKRYIHDYLVATDGAQFKVRQFCEATGLLAQYESGELDAEMCDGKIGKCKIAIEPARGEYAAKNKVQAYLKASGNGAAATHTPAQRRVNPDLDDEIPF